MASPGRNDLCPCGSSRKFKQCSLRVLDPENAARARLRTAEGVLVPALFVYAANESVFQACARMRNCFKHVAVLHLLTTMVVPLLSPSGSWFFSDL